MCGPLRDSLGTSHVTRVNESCNICESEALWKPNSHTHTHAHTQSLTHAYTYGGQGKEEFMPENGGGGMREIKTRKENGNFAVCRKWQFFSFLTYDHDSM